MVKAVGDWELDVLGIPFGGPYNGKDADGERFSPQTNLHLDKYPYAPVVHYHGFNEDGTPTKAPEYIGKTESHEVKEDGVWFRVILDKASEIAKGIMQAAKEGLARASSGSVSHLTRIDKDGHIREWPVAELSIFDTRGGMEPANNYAVAIPVNKALYEDIYKQAGQSLPAKFANTGDSKNTIEDGGDNGNSKTQKQKKKEVIKMTLTKEEKQALIDEGRKEAEAEFKAEADKKKEIADGIAEGIKADKDKRDEEAAEAKKLADKKEEEEKEEKIKARRLGTPGSSAYVAKYSHLWKYDNLEIGDHAFAIELLASTGVSKTVKAALPSEDSMKALAIKVAEDKDEDGRLVTTKMAMKSVGMPIKSDELNQSTLADFGDEWVGVLHSNDLWLRISEDTPVIGRVPTMVVPQGAESVNIPVQSTPPTFYKVAQAADMAANPGETTKTVKVSKMGTANQILTVDKLGAASTFTEELSEDSVIQWAPELRRSIVEEAQKVLESLVIDGDTETGATTNINDIAGTPAGDEYWLIADGFRKLALVTNTANSRDGGSLTDADFLETVKLMGLGGKNAIDRSQVSFILDLWTYWKALELAQVKTKDVFSAPTIEDGVLTSIWGYGVVRSAQMHRPNQDATYGLKANSAGKLDLDVAANNTKGALLAVRYDQWRLGWKRRMTIETERVPRADSTEITALMRVGLINRDDEASAISYNLGV